ncbi:hypothetical protein Rhal01_03143 [Rubritalea halochordaticola]|uniref:Uncharacterized protein n=1 Tax=Rubritalea halochordaticola TaxID=714537 RepID=A0ABP9V4P3_9BACT
MKLSLTSLVAVLMALTSVSYGAQDRPKLVRVHLMTVQMAHTDYIQYSREKGKATDYERVQQYIANKRAVILDVNCVTSRSGEKATLESVREYIYPSEYNPPGSLEPVNQNQKQFEAIPRGVFLRPSMQPAFETRNLGVTLELEPMIGEVGKIVDLRFAPEFVDQVGFSEWLKFKDEWGRADKKFPTFLSHRVQTGQTLAAGRFAMVNTFTGKNGKGELDPSRKILVFVMAEILILPEPVK